MPVSPSRTPVGLQLARTAHAFTQGFERSMAEAKRHDELLCSGLTVAEAELLRGLLEKVGAAVSEAA